jgi:hypothetical protein
VNPKRTPGWERLVTVMLIVLPLSAFTVLVATVYHASKALEGNLAP